MVRLLLCRGCGEPLEKRSLPPEDRYHGWKQRHIYVAIIVPGLVCDFCAAPLSGNIAIATTRWNKRDGENPAWWERHYGEILDPSIVEAADTLSK